MFVLEVPDDRLDGGSSSHLALDGGRHVPPLACGIDPELVARRRIVTFVAGVGEYAPDLSTDVRDDVCKRMAVIGIAGQRLGMKRELAALGAMQRGGNGNLHAKLVRRLRFSLADAFDLRGMKAIDLAASLMTALVEHPTCQMQRPEEDRLEIAPPAICLPMSRIVRPR